MSLLTPPSFMSPDRFSARFKYTPRGGDSMSMVLATTGHSAIRRAWQALRQINWASTDLYRMGSSGRGPRAYITNYGGAVESALFQGTSFETALPRGTRWDNDFTRALWSWYFLQWDAQARASGAPTASDQLFGAATSAQRDGWLRTLETIEACEVTQSISQDALFLFALMLATTLGLVQSGTQALVQIEDGTLPFAYNTDPPLPSYAGSTRGYEFKVWPVSGGTPDTGTFLSDTPSDGTGGGSGGGGTGGGTTTPGGGGTPLPPPPSSIPRTIVTTAFVIGGFMVIAGASLLILSPKER